MQSSFSRKLLALLPLYALIFVFIYLISLQQGYTFETFKYVWSIVSIILGIVAYFIRPGLGSFLRVAVFLGAILVVLNFFTHEMALKGDYIQDTWESCTGITLPSPWAQCRQPWFGCNSPVCVGLIKQNKTADFGF